MTTQAPNSPAGRSTRRKVTPPQYARQLGVDTAKVLKWIRSGELRAIDASTTRGSRPRYLIDVADILTFEAGRSVQPPTPRPQRRRRQTGVIEFFK
jgi:hypothetical protein